MIGDGIEVKIIGVDGDQVKLGIEAPRHIKVHRQEVFEAIQSENKAALDVTEQLINQLKNF